MNLFLLGAAFDSALSYGLGLITKLAFVVAIIMVISAGWAWRSGRPDEAKATLLGAVLIALASGNRLSPFQRWRATNRQHWEIIALLFKDEKARGYDFETIFPLKFLGVETLSRLLLYVICGLWRLRSRSQPEKVFSNSQPACIRLWANNMYAHKKSSLEISPQICFSYCKMDFQPIFSLLCLVGLIQTDTKEFPPSAILSQRLYFLVQNYSHAWQF